MDGPYTHADFVRQTLAEFPELRAEFDANEGLLHMQMHALTRVAQRAKGAGDWATYARCIHLAHELWRRPDEDLRSALNVSFLEHLDFDGPRGTEAWARLTSELQHGWRAMRAYNEQLAARGRPKPKERPPKPRRRHQ